MERDIEERKVGFVELILRASPGYRKPQCKNCGTIGKRKPPNPCNKYVLDQGKHNCKAWTRF